MNIWTYGMNGVNMIKEIATNIRIGYKTIKSEDFKKACKDFLQTSKEITMRERKDLLDLKRAFIEQKQAYKQSYDQERRDMMISLFTRVAAAYKAERIKHLIDSESVETVFD